MAKLDGEQMRELRDSILSAYTAGGETELDQMLQGHNLPRLNALSGAGRPLPDVVWDVITRAEAQGWTADLLRGLKADRPGRTDLHPLWDESLERVTGFAAPSALFTIPAPVGDFTGRADELDALVAHLSQDGSSAHIAGLRGMGGVGKTQLAYAVAASLRARYPDAALLVPMQAGETLVSAEAALQAVLRAFQPEARLPDDLSALQGLYRAALAGKRGALLLDNAAAPEQVAPLLPPPEGWCALVTSRERFGLPGAAKLVNLGVLPDGEAVELLRVSLVGNGRADAAADTGLTGLAKLCGGLPMALRVAAGYLTTYTDVAVSEYTTTLRKEGRRLAKLQAPGEPSVTAALALSVTRLAREDAPLAARWRELAVFPAPFDRASAAAVWGELNFPEGAEEPTLTSLDAEATADALRELVRRSLLDYDAATGLYRLHDLLREYALADAESTDALAPAQMRHAWHYLAAGEAANRLYLAKDGALAGLQAFDVAWPHLRAAHARLTGQADPIALLWRSRFPYRTASVLDLRATPAEHIPLLEDALAAASALGDRRSEAAALGNLGLAYADLGDARRAGEIHEQHLALTRAIGDRYGEGNALGNLGNAYLAQGDPRRAVGYYEQQLEITRTIGDRRGESNALGNLGVAYRNLGDARQAISYHEQHLTMARALGDQRGEARALTNLGIGHTDLGDSRRAIGYYEQALAIARTLGDRRTEGNIVSSLGVAYKDLGDPGRAISYYEEALAIARALGNRRGESDALGNLGVAHKNLGEVQQAIAYYQQALVIDRETGNRQGESSTLGDLGIAYAILGDIQQAIGYFEQQLEMTRATGDRRNEGIVLGNLANAYTILGDVPQAIGNYKQQLEIAREIGNRQGEAIGSWNLGLLYDSQGDHARAAELMQIRVDFEREIGHPDTEKHAARLAEVRAKIGTHSQNE